MLASEMSPELPEQSLFSEGQDFDFAVPDHKTRIVLRETAQLTPHPRNKAIYGEEDVSDLVDQMRHFEWVKPLVCTSNNTIISGHRRWKAAIELGIESVPVEVREFPDKTAELEALLLENASRFKTTEQKVREGIAWSDIEKEKARERQRFAAHATNQKLSADNQDALCENFHAASKGRAADAIASRVGFGSGRTYQKASAVVLEMDLMKEHTPEAALALRKTLNEQSVDAAHMLMKKPPEERQAIATLILSGEAKSTKQAQQIIKKDSSAEFNDPSQETCGGYSVAKPQVYVDPRDEADGATQSDEELPEKFSDKPAEVVENVGSFSSSEPQPKNDGKILEFRKILVKEQFSREALEDLIADLVYLLGGVKPLGSLAIKLGHQYEILELCHEYFDAMNQETFAKLDVNRIKLRGLIDSDIKFLNEETDQLLRERNITRL